MEKIKEALELVEDMEQKYSIKEENLQEIRKNFDDFKVYIPLIGKFSAGKSSLINTLLGWGTEICKENIGVETAFPTEIFYGDEDFASVYGKETRILESGEYMEARDTLSAENTEKVKLQLRNEVLEQFPSVALVDMPGLDSGYEVHDQAIQNYIKNSMAYVLVFPAKETTVQESMEPVLRDLDIYDMPMCVVLTRGNRLCGAEEQEQEKREVRKNLSKYFGTKEIPVFITERETGDLGGFEEFLIQMEEQANELGRKYYKKRLEPEFSKVSNYLSGYLKNMDLTYSELEEEKEHLEQDMEKLHCSVEKELDEFQRQIPGIVQETAGAVRAALSQHLEELVSDLVHDTDVTSAINEIVRTSLNNSYQHRVMDRLKQHLDKIAANMTVGSADYASCLKIDMDAVCGKEISGIGRTAIDVVALLVAGPLGGIVAHFVTGLLNKMNSERRREEKHKMKMNLTGNVFPAVEREVADKVEIDLKRILQEVRQAVEKEVGEQLEVLQKSLAEVMEKKQLEDKSREQETEMIQGDLKRLEEIQAWD